MPDRPSFLLFITDQQRADYLGCAGHPLLKTPNIDALAARGVLFERFFVASPVCMPNRASLMTGRLPVTHGVRWNGSPLRRDQVTVAEILRAAGYDTALIGKSHLQNFTSIRSYLPDPTTRAGFTRPPGVPIEAVRHDLDDPFYRSEHPDFWAGLAPCVPTPFYGFDHVELVTGHGDEVGGDYTRWLLEREPEAARLIGRDNQLPHDYVVPQAVRTAVPEALYSTTYIAERAQAWLRSRRDSERPFLLVVSWPDPHHPFNPPGRYWGMYDPAAMKVPEAYGRNDWQPPPVVAAMLAERGAGKAALGGMNAFEVSEREAREAQALTCGMIAMIDDSLGGIMESLGAAGRADDTVIAFTADHGDHLGDHRLLLKGAAQYEEITRVPFIWCDPQGPQGTRSTSFGQTHDIPATILERARIEPPVGMQGGVLADIGMATAPPRDHAFIQYEHQRVNDATGLPPRVHTVRTAAWRLSLTHGATQGELYDLRADPGEFTNLWDDPASLAARAELLEILARDEIAAVDTVPLPTGRA